MSRYIYSHEAINISITGPAGTGKTYLANAIGVMAITQFRTVKYARPNLLLNELKNCDLQGTLPSKIQELLKADILIIDDFGMMKMDSDHCRVLFELLESREETLPTIFTSQLPVSRWYQLIEDSTYADACMDRILGNSIRIELKGESRRMNKKAKEEQKEDQDVKEA